MVSEVATKYISEADISGIVFAIAGNEGTPRYCVVPDLPDLQVSDEDSVAVNNQAVGTAITRTYELPFQLEGDYAGRVILFARWRYRNTGGAAGAGNTARVNFTLEDSGGAIGGVVATNGTTVTAGAAWVQRYEELCITLPETAFNVGDTLDLIVTVEVVATGTQNLDVELYTDPDHATDYLGFLLQVT